MVEIVNGRVEHFLTGDGFEYIGDLIDVGDERQASDATGSRRFSKVMSTTLIIIS